MLSKWKTRLCIMLCASLCLGLTMVSAGAVETEKTKWFFEKTSHADDIVPYWNQIAHMTASLRFENGQAVAGGEVRSQYGGVNAEVYVELQGDSGMGFSVISSTSATGAGRDGVLATFRHPVRSGYGYRVKVYAVIKDSQGAILETDTMYTDVKIAP